MAARDLFNDRRLQPDDIADLVGAPHDAEVKITKFRTTPPYVVLKVTVKHPLYDGEQIRTIGGKSGGDVSIKNELFKLKENTPQGTGTSVFHRQVQEARARGVKEIQTHAYRSDGFNGYYTWPRLGYDADIPENFKKFYMTGEERVEWGRPIRVSDLMKHPKARENWKNFGESTDMTFDLREGSLSNYILDAYIDERIAAGR